MPKGSFDHLHTALLSATSQIRLEIFTMIFTKRRFIFGNRWGLMRLCEIFRPYVHMMQTVDLFEEMLDSIEWHKITKNDPRNLMEASEVACQSMA